GLLVLPTVPPLLPAPVPLKVAAPPGAGAEAIDVAGRFAQPVAARVSSTTGTTKNRVVIAFLQSVPSVALDGPCLVPASAAERLAQAPAPRSSVIPSSTARASAIPPRPPDAASPILLADRRRHAVAQPCRARRGGPRARRRCGGGSEAARPARRS